MPAASIMVKPASGSCNLRCEYCFYRDVAQHRQTPGYGIMTKKTARALIESAAQYAGNAGITFVFQGGEPLLAGEDFFRFFIDTVKEVCGTACPVSYSLQTNGTLLTKNFAKLFSQNKFLLGLSLDGDFEANRFRTDADNKNVYRRVLQSAALLRRMGAEFNILSVVTGYSGSRIEKTFNSFAANGFKYLQFIPCLRAFGDTSESELYMTCEQYAEFLLTLTRLYFDRLDSASPVSVRQLDNWLGICMGYPPEQCGMNGGCSRQFAVESNGNVYPCDFYCTDKWLLGNVNEMPLTDMAQSEAARSFIEQGDIRDEKCLTCEFYYLCRAQGCKRSREDADMCKAYKEFFPYFIMRAAVYGSGESTRNN